MRKSLNTKHGRMRLLLLLLTVIMIMSSLPAAVWADDGTLVDSGECGTNLTWTLTETDNGMTLTISGSGSMADYNSASPAPWASYKNSINEVIIDDRVTTIGKFAFNGLKELHEIELPDSLKTIYNYAFAGCGLRHVTIPDGVRSLKFRAFYNNYLLETIVIPGSVQNEQYDTRYSLDWCSKLKYIFYSGTSQQWTAYGFGIVNSGNPETYKFPDAIVHYESTDHTYDHVAGTAASCESDGMKDHYECPVCRALFVEDGGIYIETTEDDLVIRAAHQWGEPTYIWADDNSTVTATRVCSRDESHFETETAATASEVTTPATATADGEIQYTAVFENTAFETQTRAKVIPAEGYAPGQDPTQKGSDGTPAGKGASEACVNKAITSSTSEEGPAGTKFGPLTLKSTKQTNTSVTLTWKGASGAKKYVIYGSPCGKKNKMKKIAVTTKKTYTVKKAGKKVKKGTYYKFIVVALDKNSNVVSTSKVVHVATKGGKVKNPTKVTVKNAVIKKAKALRKGKTLKLNAKQGGKSVKKHRAICYESTNTKIATVSKKGVVKAKAKGTCYVYAYAQNGIFKKIKVVVK